MKPLILAIALLLAACHRAPECTAPTPTDGGLTPAETPCMGPATPEHPHGTQLPDGSPCCVGTTLGKCQSNRCVTQ